jgi:hypothetical protein
MYIQYVIHWDDDSDSVQLYSSSSDGCLTLISDKTTLKAAKNHVCESFKQQNKVPEWRSDKDGTFNSLETQPIKLGSSKTWMKLLIWGAAIIGSFAFILRLLGMV